MDNEFGNTDGSLLRQKEDVNDGVTDARVEGNAGFVSHHQSDDLDGDEIFEEAIDVKSFRVDLGEIAIDESGNVEEIEISVGADRIADDKVVQEADEFYEADGIPSDTQKHLDEPLVAAGGKVEALEERETTNASDNVLTDNLDIPENGQIGEESNSTNVEVPFPEDANEVNERHAAIVDEIPENGSSNDDDDDKNSKKFVGDGIDNSGMDGPLILSQDNSDARDMNVVMTDDHDSRPQKVLKGENQQQGENGPLISSQDNSDARDMNVVMTDDHESRPQEVLKGENQQQSENGPLILSQDNSDARDMNVVMTNDHDSRPQEVLKGENQQQGKNGPLILSQDNSDARDMNVVMTDDHDSRPQEVLKGENQQQGENGPFLSQDYSDARDMNVVMTDDHESRPQEVLKGENQQHGENGPLILSQDNSDARDRNVVMTNDHDSRPPQEVLKGENQQQAETNVEFGKDVHVQDMQHEGKNGQEVEEHTSEHHCTQNQTEDGENVNDIMTSTVKQVKHDDVKEMKPDTSVQEKQHHSIEEQDGASDTFDVKDQGDVNQELKHTPTIVELDHERSREAENEACKPVEETKVTPVVGSSPALDDSEVSQSKHADDNTKPLELLEMPAKEEAKVQEPKAPNGDTLRNSKQKIKAAGDTSSYNGKSFVPTRMPNLPAGLGNAAPLLEPASRVPQPARTVSPLQNQLIEEPNGDADENDETREKLQMIRVKFLRLAYRLGQTPHNGVVAQVLYRLGLAEQLRGRNGGRVAAFSFDRASAMAEQLEAAGQEPLDFSCTIMVLGKTGVGKSATINSIFDDVKSNTDAFQVGTKKVQDVVGTVQGIKVRIIDTPGLVPSWSGQHHNGKVLHSVKRFMKKTPPDIVLYLDRLDMQSRDFGDMPLLHKITEVFGPSIWFNAIVVLTHAASAPPEGPNGTVSSYDMFVSQRSHVVQQAIRQAAGDVRLMNPVALVENHSACRTNRAGQRVLPTGQVWKPDLLLLSFASKILAEANMLPKLQDYPPGRPFSIRSRAPSLHFFVSSLLQSRPQVKLPAEQYGGDDDEDGLDDDEDDSSDSDVESEYDELPPFKQLTKAQLSKLTKAQKKAYYDELEYREKLFMKKQLKEEKKRRKLMKEMADSVKDLPSGYNESAEEEGSRAASVPVPMSDMPLPASFDSDNPSHRYRSLDSMNQWLVRPVLDSHGWDHDVGYEGINAERLFVLKDKVPVSVSGQLTNDKKDLNIQMDVASSIQHGDGKATSLGFDMQTMGKDIVYTMRGETKFCNMRKNKAKAGVSVTLLGDLVTGGAKIEDKLIVNKRGQLVMTGAAVVGRGSVGWGGSLEATLRDKDHPLGRFLSTVGLSVIEAHGDHVLGCNAQSQIPIGRFSNLIGRVNLNNRGTGQVSVRLNSSEHLQIVLVGLIPVLRKLVWYFDSENF